jgi:hypothetical protein
MTDAEPIERLEFDAQALVTEHPPVWRDRNKQVVHAIACPPGAVHRGTLRYARWGALPLPEHTEPGPAPTRVIARPGFFDYGPVLQAPDALEWHVNFADPHLFVAYGSPLFAQDEMQVAEHPALGSLKEALDARGLRARTVDGHRPTPVLVMGVERRCRVATEPSAAEGRPHGLYGNAFAWASQEAIRRATTRIDPPTVSNLIAMAAPSGGYGRYTPSQIEHVLVTAFTGFRAAVLESERFRGAPCPVVVHTGFWGCGAFGGHRVLMTLLQVLAARMAGIDVLAFHYGDESGVAAFHAVETLLREELAPSRAQSPRDLIQAIAELGYEWGVSDGN